MNALTEILPISSSEVGVYISSNHHLLLILSAFILVLKNNFYSKMVKMLGQEWVKLGKVLRILHYFIFRRLAATLF